MSTPIPVDRLREGDVFLYHGTSFIAKAIRFFDGTPVNHAGLYLGDSKVGEAIASGLGQQDLATSIEDATWVEAHRLVENVDTMDPVTTVAGRYLKQGNRYGFEQILLLAFLALTRKLKVTPVLAVLIRAVLDKAASLLLKLTAGGKEPMICSEFVYRCYDEALLGADDCYSLWVYEGVDFHVPRTQSGVPGASPTPRLPRGQGIHPDSVLALLQSAPVRTWFQDLAPPPAAARELPREPEDAAIDTLIERYFTEVHSQLREVPGPSSLQDLAAATDRFAASLLPQAAKAALPGGPSRRDAAFGHLLQAAADFVTPGDLLKTQRLYLLGKIKGA